jgi:hypothetical protein
MRIPNDPPARPTKQPALAGPRLPAPAVMPKVKGPTVVPTGREQEHAGRHKVDEKP